MIMNKQYNGLIPDEILVDNFAGGGGASSGLEAAFGRPVDVAINHDPKALAMHRINHPNTMHFCESVWNVDPIEVTANQPVGLVWLSPDCRHFSKAKGGKPVSKNIRGLAWIAIRWALKCKARVIILENVEEFVTWGPVLDDVEGKQLPCKERRGETFNGFIQALSTGLPAGSPAFRDMYSEIFKYNYDIKEKLHIYKSLRAGLGYDVDYRLLHGCDYGAPTNRKRFFLVARRDGLPICWPKATHGNPDSIKVKQGKLKPWRTAAECIDWTIAMPSIYDRKIPLVENSQKRVSAGTTRYVVENPKPYTVKQNIGSMTGQLNIIQDKSEARLDTDIIAPFIAKNYTGVVGSSIEEPLHTVTAIDHNSLVAVFLRECEGEHVNESVDDCAHGLVNRYNFGLIKVEGKNYRVSDIGYRMLQPRELFTAQGFRPDYIIDRGIDENGNTIKLNKSEQTRMAGNSVCPPLSEALARANFTHEEKFKMVV